MLFKNKFIIFLILILAVLSIGVASAEDVSSLNTTVSTDLMNDSSTEVVASEYGEINSLNVSEDSSQLQGENMLKKSSEDVNNLSDGNTLDYDVNSISDSKTFTELNTTIVGANGNLILDSNYKMADSEADTFVNGINISKNINIDGNGFVIDANNLGRIFNIANGYAISLTNVTLINGKSDGDGGAIFNKGNLILNNVDFINNLANFGGAVLNDGDKFIVNACTFINNSARNGGGAIYDMSEGFSVSSSAFVNNTAYRFDAVYSMSYCNANGNWWGNNTPNFENLVHSNVIHDNYAVLSVTLVANNTISINFYKNGTDEVLPISRDVKLAIGNNITTEKIVNGNFTKAYEVPKGNYNITATVDNQKLSVNFRNNIYVDYEGGDDYNSGADWNNALKTIEHAMKVVFANGNVYLADGTHIVNNRVSIGNTVSIIGNGSKTVITNNRNGNGVFNVTANNVAIYNCTFVNNTASERGGAILNDGDNCIINACTFINGTAGDGGVIYNDGGANFAVITSNFINNAVSSTGGVIYNSNGVNFNVIGSNFTSNGGYGLEYGNVIYNGGSGEFHVVGSNFIDNCAYWCIGGVIYNAGASFIVECANFINNSADMGMAGVIYNEGNFIVDRSNFTNNTAAMGGDVIYNSNGNCSVNGSIFICDVEACLYPILNYVNLTLTNNKYFGLNDNEIYVFNEGTILSQVIVDVLGNTTISAEYGDSFRLFANITTLDGARLGGHTLKFNIDDNNYTADTKNNGDYIYNNFIFKFIGNKIVNAFYLGGKDVVVKTSIFKSPNYVYVDYNNGDDNNAGVSWDTAVKTINKALTISQNNSVIYLADGTHIVDKRITIGASLTIVGNGSKTVITNNRNGNGVFNVTANNVAIYNCTFANNIVNSDGGVIYNYDGVNCTVGNSNFINNSAESGAAIFNWGGVDFTVSSCTFVNNAANGHGGAICNFDNVNFTVVNSTFIDNSAESGGAVFNSGLKFTVANSTFIDNSAESGGAVFNYYGASFNVTTSSFINNTAKNGGDAIYNIAVCKANDNWWGNNTPAWDKLFNGNVAHDSYAVLNLTANINNIVVNFYKNGTTDVVSVSRDFKLTIINQTIADKIVDGTFEIAYAAPIIGNYNITATVDSQKLTVNVDNNNVYVDYENGSDENNGASWSSAVKTIANAMDKALDNCNVYLAEGTHVVNNQINIKKTVSIIGNGNKTSITNNGNGDGVFKVTANNVAIYNCTFENNNINDWGGAIDNSGVNFTVSDCTFINNIARYGGAIFNDGVGFTVSNSTFINNTAEYGGAIFNQAVVDVTIANSIFINNSAEYGGAIENFGTGNLVVIDNVFDNNIATKGVAIYNTNSYVGKGTLNLTNNKYSGITEGKTYIYNNAVISSPVTVTVLGNKTVNAQYDKNVTLFVTITTADGASVSGGLLNFIIGDNNYTATSYDNGIYNCSYTPDFIGKQVIGAYYANADNLTIETGILDVKIASILNVGDIVMTYHDGSRLVAKLMDLNSNPIANATLYFTINGKNYNKTTDVNGSASIGLNLESGKYLATITYNGSDIYYNVSKNAAVTVNPSIIANDLVKMYQNDTQFYATFLGKHGEVLANTIVKFNINGVLYNRTTNASGVAKLNINLRPGNYTLTAYNPVTGEELGFNVLVKSLIIASDLTKYYNNASKFEAKIYDKNGSLAVNKTVTFNINGMFYTRQTDTKGVVSLNINLRPGDYIITTIYEGLEVSNNVKVLPTLITDDLAMSYHDGSKFNASVLDGQGNPLANETVLFNVNGVLYSKLTGNDGVASLNINLNKGNYIITSMWDNYQVGNNITIS